MNPNKGAIIVSRKSGLNTPKDLWVSLAGVLWSLGLYEAKSRLHIVVRAI